MQSSLWPSLVMPSGTSRHCPKFHCLINTPFLLHRCCDSLGEMPSLASHLVCILHKFLYLNLVGLLNMHSHDLGELHTQAGTVPEAPHLPPITEATAHVWHVHWSYYYDYCIIIKKLVNGLNDSFALVFFLTLQHNVCSKEVFKVVFESNAPFNIGIAKSYLT